MRGVREVWWGCEVCGGGGDVWGVQRGECHPDVFVDVDEYIFMAFILYMQINLVKNINSYVH